MACAEKTLPAFGVDVDWYTTRERTYEEVLPWDHLDSGLDKDWLWEDWQDSLDETEVEDCRWTPCFDCGVCPQMDTDIQIGPTGKKLLPLTVVKPGHACRVADPARRRARRPERLGKRQPEGPPPAPAVQRIRLRYTKRGRLRFTSHRDIPRAFERALRRAEVPMAYSAGFTPHPKMSYANAAPTGMGSEAEYLEIALTERA